LKDERFVADVRARVSSLRTWSWTGTSCRA